MDAKTQLLIELAKVVSSLAPSETEALNEAIAEVEKEEEDAS